MNREEMRARLVAMREREKQSKFENDVLDDVARDAWASTSDILADIREESRRLLHTPFSHPLLDVIFPLVGQSIYLGLHDESDREISYTGYARVAVARSQKEWDVSTNTVFNRNPIVFPSAPWGSNAIVRYAQFWSADVGGERIFQPIHLEHPVALWGEMTNLSFPVAGISVTVD